MVQDSLTVAGVVGTVATAASQNTEATTVEKEEKEKKATNPFKKLQNDKQTAEEQKQQMLAEIDAKIEELKAKIASKEGSFTSKIFDKSNFPILGFCTGGLGALVIDKLIDRKKVPPTLWGFLATSSLLLLSSWLKNSDINSMKEKLENLKQQRQEIQNTDFTAMA